MNLCRYFNWDSLQIVGHHEKVAIHSLQFPSHPLFDYCLPRTVPITIAHKLLVTMRMRVTRYAYLTFHPLLIHYAYLSFHPLGHYCLR